MRHVAERVAVPLAASVFGANTPIRRSSSGKFDPGSSPGVKIGIGMEAYCPPFWT